MVGGIGEQKQTFDVAGQPMVGLSNLQLKVKICAVTQTAHYDRGAYGFGKMNSQPGIALYLYMGGMFKRLHSLCDHRHALFGAIAGRRGKQIAVVALARKLAGILYAMWRDGTEFGIAGQDSHRIMTGS